MRVSIDIKSLSKATNLTTHYNFHCIPIVSWQLGLVEGEINEILRGRVTAEQRPQQKAKQVQKKKEQ